MYLWIEDAQLKFIVDCYEWLAHAVLGRTSIVLDLEVQLNTLGIFDRIQEPLLPLESLKF